MKILVLGPRKNLVCWTIFKKIGPPLKILVLVCNSVRYVATAYEKIATIVWLTGYVKLALYAETNFDSYLCRWLTS